MTGPYCRICGNEEGLVPYEVREMYFGTGDVFGYLECPSCLCLQIKAIPDDMNRHYPKGYYSMEPLGESFGGGPLRVYLRRLRNRYLFFREGYAGRILAWIHPPVPFLRLLMRVGTFHGRRILDVGCGSGSLVYYLKESGIDDVSGIDPFLQEDIVYGNGARIIRKTIDELVDAGGKFDLIMFNHSFEHVSDPRATLRAASVLLHDSGVVMIRMPTVDSFAWENYRSSWCGIDAPRHLHVLSRKSLGLLASECGLAITDTVYDSVEFQFWGSEQIRKDIALTSSRSYLNGIGPSVFTKAQMQVFKRRAEELNRVARGDQAAYYLRKSTL